MKTRHTLSVFLIVASQMVPCIAAEEPKDGSGEIITRAFGTIGETNWNKFLVDNAAGSISAAGMLGINGESISTVENVRDVMVALKGMGSGNSNGTLAVAVTPARSGLIPMNLSSYATSPWMRVLGSTTLGYAQADKSIESKNYQQRALSIETSFYFNEDDDPILAYANKVKLATHSKLVSDDCYVNRPSKPKGLPTTEQPKFDEKNSDAQTATNVTNDEGEKPENQATKARAIACHKKVAAATRWNRSRFSFAYAAGWIKPKEGVGDQISLGRTAVVGVTYGFDHFDRLNKVMAASLTLRRTTNEPVLTTLQAASVKRVNSSLAALRLTTGDDNSNVRSLVEVSNAKSGDVTASQRAFKRAIGIDYRIAEAMWLNFRIGQQRKIDGTSNETGGLFSLSYSPTALLNK